jgi:hypothetical protein
LFKLYVFASQHQLKRITWLERHLLGIRGADQQLTIRLHCKTVIGAASISTTLSSWFVQCNAFGFKESLQKLQQVDAFPTTLRDGVVTAGFRFLGLAQGC